MKSVARVEEGMRVVVVGLGRSGRSAVRFCQGLGARVFVSDSGPGTARDVDWLRAKGVEYEFGGHSPSRIAGADLVLVSPGVPIGLPVFDEARRRGVTVAGELALAPAHLRTPVVAVTGTNGKTTVTSLLGALLTAAGKQVFVGGNIGTPLVEYLTGPQDADWLVLEASSFQLEAAGMFRPDIGVLLNITPDHLDRHGDMSGYGEAKMKLFRHQGGSDAAVFNGDDPVVAGLFAATAGVPAGRRLRFSRRPGSEAVVAGGRVRLGGEFDESYDLSGTRLAERPNDENAAAAILAARLCGCPPAAVRHGLRGFAPPSHRMEVVAEIDGVRYINDSKATNEGAACAALAALEPGVLLIAGGRGKGGGYDLLAGAVAAKVVRLLLIGEAGEEMEAAFGSLVPTERCVGLEEAVRRAAAVARPGQTVLLSPACASFDMFSGYAERGQRFTACVRALAAGGKAP